MRVKGHVCTKASWETSGNLRWPRFSLKTATLCFNLEVQQLWVSNNKAASHVCILDGSDRLLRLIDLLLCCIIHNYQCFRSTCVRSPSAICRTIVYPPLVDTLHLFVYLLKHWMIMNRFCSENRLQAVSGSQFPKKEERSRHYTKSYLRMCIYLIG